MNQVMVDIFAGIQYSSYVSTASGLVATSSLLGSSYCVTINDFGPAINTSINLPRSLALDTSGNIYITDSLPRLRFINITTNIIITITGGLTGSMFSIENSTASVTKFNSLQGISIDFNGDIYFADNGLYKIIKYNYLTKKLTTYAGNGINIVAGDGGQAHQASVRTAYSILIDRNRKMYFTDSQRVRMIDMTTNIISSIAGASGNYAYICANSLSLGSVRGIAMDTSGYLYFIDELRIRRLIPSSNSSCWQHQIVFGTGKASGILPENSPQLPLSDLGTATGLWIDPNGTFYIAESSYHRIRYTYSIEAPSGQPTSQPSGQPSLQPYSLPTGQPTSLPSILPTGPPTFEPILTSTSQPTSYPSACPTSRPSIHPSSKPTTQPTLQPTTNQPSSSPTSYPTLQPTSQPSFRPSVGPTSQPSLRLTFSISQPSTIKPTGLPSKNSTCTPSVQPSQNPFNQSSSEPSNEPTTQPTGQQIIRPSNQPTTQPTARPTSQLSGQSSTPTTQPTSSLSASSEPSNLPPSQPPVPTTTHPTTKPSKHPTSFPTSDPILQLTSRPTCRPSMRPTSQPTDNPTSKPTIDPSGLSSKYPSSPPSGQPSESPSNHPTSQPTSQPTNRPSKFTKFNGSLPFNDVLYIHGLNFDKFRTQLLLLNPLRLQTSINSNISSFNTESTVKLPTARDFIVYGREGGYATVSITLTTSTPPNVMDEDYAMLPSSG
eukprot:gene12777-14003_t